MRAEVGVAKDAIDSWLTISPDNRITIFVGKVDLGTGARTALMQMAAEELDVSFERIEMVMGDTATTPDQWLTAGKPHDLPGRRGAAAGGGQRDAARWSSAPRSGSACRRAT